MIDMKKELMDLYIAKLVIKDCLTEARKLKEDIKLILQKKDIKHGINED